MVRVLIVDDSPSMRSIVMHGLRRAGLGVDSFTLAADGAEALAALEQGGVDLVLCDVSMPRTCGIDLVRRIRLAHPDRPPILLMTAHGSAELLRQARCHGADGCVTKSATSHGLFDAIDPHLR